MRMMKRLAVCVLAAAMSLTMLTACGGDTPSAPETPSNPGTSQGSGSGNDNGNNNSGNNNGQKPGKEDENTLPTSWNASKTKAYMLSKGVSDTNIYVNGTLNEMDANLSSVKSTTQVVYAAKGSKLYISLTDNTGLYEFYKNDKDEYFASNNGGAWVRCMTPDDITTAKNNLLVGQVVYKVPRNPSDFKAFNENDYLYESMTSRWSTGVNVGYIYTYTSDNQLAGSFCMMETKQDTVFFTFPMTLSSNPSDGMFPDL